MPPDLSEAERPLAVFPHESSQETTCDNPPPRLAAECITSSIGRGVPREEHHPLPRPVAESADSITGKGGGGQVHQPQGCDGGSRVGDGAVGSTNQGGVTQVASSSVSLFRLSPALRATFASVGATDTAYPFREILLMLKHYLYSKKHLFDPDDLLFINCGDDELGRTLGVTRFHYNDVKLLMAKQITQIRTVHNTHIHQTPDTTGADIAKAHRAVVNGDTQRAIDVCEERTCNSSAINTKKGENEINGRTQLPVLNTCIVSSTTSVEGRNGLVSDSTLAAASPVAGSSRQSSENVSGGRRRRRTRSIASYSICVPDIPDSNSDVESIYSYQGYETAFCRNTEFEESEDEAEDESELFEEYEIADDDDDVQEQDHSDDDDSVIEDVEVALLAIHALCQDESDEDFWADDSDTEDQSTDDDPELVAERWDCLSCGLRNKPFVRYCGKCWQIRKNWLPDRPKKRRRKRKPRPKKRSRLRSDSVKSEDMNFLQSKTETNEEQSATSASFTSDSSQEVQDFEVLTNTRQEFQDFGVLTKTLSTASTVSVIASPVRSFSVDIHSSQDSGVCLSQDSFTDFSPEFIMEDTKNSNKRTETEVEVTSQSGSAEEQPKTSEGLSTTSASASKAEAKEDSQGRKRKSMSIEEEEEGKPSKKAKLESSSEEESEEGDVEEQAKSFYQFLQSNSGKEWLKSPDSKPFLSSAPVKEALMEAIVANMSSGSSTDVHEPPSGLSIMCSICFLRPKNASIIHGRLSHQATCYQCARRLLNSGSRCPVCRRKIHMVCKHIIA
ncbi:E3 ubiquitin-protein ligase Mdm2-like isoform X3 [Penaeus japonicus]|nr:E3 ubiquitin-protein ligase Mdm2-like isoform X3 [Penaeus japonicus]XP_042884841.1 E3 ubiquitin-protein ligase Mdm2-like isoform X3 [Penaeus japonicus]